MNLTCIYSGLMIFGGAFLLISLIVGEISEGAEGLLGGFDNFLEGIGIDLIPDNLELGEGESHKGIGCGSIAAFITGFGAAGLAATFFKLAAVWTVLAALGFGIVTGGIYVGVMTFVIRQQANSLIRVTDFIGLRGRMTIDCPAGQVGQVAVTVRGELKNYPAIEEGGLALNRGDQIEVVNLEGGRLYVKKIQ